MRTHTGEKPFRCKVCNTRFSTKSHLNRHSRIHTGEKPFQCQRCEFKTLTRSHLARHMLKHSGEKPFTCPNCDFKCARKSNLKRHMQLHNLPTQDSPSTGVKSARTKITALTKTIRDKTTLLEMVRKELDTKARLEQTLLLRIQCLEKRVDTGSFEREKALQDSNMRLVIALQNRGVSEEEISMLLTGPISFDTQRD